MPLLTNEQLDKLRQILRDSATAVSISTMGSQVSAEQMQRLVEMGYVDPGDVHDLVLDSFEAGRLLSADPGARDLSFAQLQAQVAKQPEMTAQEKMAVEFLRGRAGQFCVGLGTRAEGDVTLKVADLDQELAESFRRGIERESALAASKRQSVGKLATELRQLSFDWARDWGRIASTESQMAHQVGYIEATGERYGSGAMMAKIPEPGACEDCKRLYLDSDGKPRVEPLEWWQGNGVANYGKKRQNWEAVMGAMHPWCQCQIVRVPEGWGFNDAWDLVPDTEIEKSQFSGSAGLVETDRAVGTMRYRADVDRAPREQKDHPLGREARKKKKKRKITKHPARERMTEIVKRAGNPVSEKPEIHLDIPVDKRNRERVDAEARTRSERSKMR